VPQSKDYVIQAVKTDIVPTGQAFPKCLKVHVGFHQ